MCDFKKTKRLLNKSDYEFVFKQARKVTTSEFIFLYRGNQFNGARLGLALSKKIVSKAHDRNRLKRLLRETFRHCELPAMDVVVLARRGVEKLDNTTIRNQLDKAWKKLSALCKT